MPIDKTILNQKPSSSGVTWNPDQLNNASIIYQVGVQMGMSSRDIQIALITAMVESNLINVNYGDRDSLGLFQQRPSQGWGTPQQVTDPRYAAGKFFSALKGLGEQRYTMGMGEAAQAVQRSAFPERYAQRISDMRGMWPKVQRLAGATVEALDGGKYKLPSSPPLGDDVPKQADMLDFFNTDPSITGYEEPLGTPDPSVMLGAWGMGSNSLGLVDAFQDEAQKVAISSLGVEPIINPSTNASVIQPLSQEVGGFEKGVDGWRKAVIQAAKTALGKPYVWGGSNLASGVDCSGLLQAAFAKAGLTLPRVSYQQANFGTRVGLDALRPGDLVAWDNSSRNVGADHIALYIGNGQILEAARPGTVVRIRTLGADEDAWGVKLNFGK